MSMKIVEPGDYPQIILVHKLKLLLLSDTSNPAEKAAHVQRLRSLFGKIGRSSEAAEIFFYFLEHDAASGRLVELMTGVPKGTVYRLLQDFEKMGIIVKAMKIAKHRDEEGGRRPWVYSLVGADMDAISTSIREHYASFSPKWRVARTLKQDILSTFKPGEPREIQYLTVMQILRDRKVPERVDVCDITVQLLNEEGVKVWK